MHLVAIDVNDAFYKIVKGISDCTIRTAERPSRNGTTFPIEEPLIITYLHPLQRVLFNEARDANPFFHLYEALWMLAGRNDVESLAYYLPRMKEYSDDGVTLNGAYGFRWRRGTTIDTSVPFTEEEREQYGVCGTVEGYETVDQLNVIVNHLKANPESRRAVLQMWTVENDLLKMEQSKDTCCNLSATFQLRTTGGGNGCGTEAESSTEPPSLDMTVFNRSNDLVWGTLGANAVHFSILQEYMAARLGVGIGVYHQVSSNPHVYSWNWHPDKWLAEYEKRTIHSPKPISYTTHVKNTVPLVKDPEVFDREVCSFVEKHSRYAMGGIYSEPFLRDVAQPLCLAFHRFKILEYEGAMLALTECKADDWRIAATGWIERRVKERERKARLAREREQYHSGQEGEIV